MKPRMNSITYRQIVITLMFCIFLTIGIWTFVNAQEDDHDETLCNVEELITHWAEHFVDTSNFAQAAQDDLDSALRELYVTGIAYQALAMQCGFNDMVEAEKEHNAEHGLATSEDMHETDDDHSAENIELATTIGDPENGEIIFNTLYPKTGFACATCHFVDSTERLIGPGLQGIGNPAHDPASHTDGAIATDEHEDIHMDDDTTIDEHEDEDAISDEHMDEDTASGEHMDEDETMLMNAVIEYIRTSILEPSEFVVDGFPDKLMPSVYGEILSDEEINDLIAYLLTLP